jgi:conjugative transfer signal peptidase TraF
MIKIDRKRVFRCIRLALISGVVPVVILAGGLLGFRVNLTPSEPLGLWRIRPLNRPATDGDLVFICPPRTKVMRQAGVRGYLKSGLCPSGYAPLIKTIAALSGQMVSIGRVVRIDGKELGHSTLSAADGQGRPLLPFGGGLIPPGDVYLHSNFPGSFDSRYFGPIPASGILGFAKEVMTYAP